MQVEFAHADFQAVTGYRVDWFDLSGGAPVHTQNVARSAVSFVSGTSPQRYVLTATRPAVLGNYQVTLTPYNGSGEGPSSSPSAPFATGVPPASAPVITQIINPTS